MTTEGMLWPKTPTSDVIGHPLDWGAGYFSEEWRFACHKKGNCRYTSHLGRN
jgi:hypothetical protein